MRCIPRGRLNSTLKTMPSAIDYQIELVQRSNTTVFVTTHYVPVRMRFNRAIPIVEFEVT
jgi:hypothetical protein